MADGQASSDSNGAVYRSLLESTKAIPWKIDWGTMRFAYIGPQIEALLGWAQESWVTAQDWATRIHPEDRERVVNFCVAQSKAGVDHEANYRALTKDNGYVWIRDVVHVSRNDKGEVDSLIGFMFDISERTSVEELGLKLLVSLDEEHVEATVQMSRRSVSLGTRAHHYLLLILARYRIHDHAAGHLPSACGWVYVEDLLDKLRVTPEQLNLEVFRIREQFGSLGLMGAADIIERRPRTRQLRLGIARLDIKTI